jgi:hypothetical protein
MIRRIESKGPDQDAGIIPEFMKANPFVVDDNGGYSVSTYM